MTARDYSRVVGLGATATERETFCRVTLDATRPLAARL
jgi:hypothetical protein